MGNDGETINERRKKHGFPPLEGANYNIKLNPTSQCDGLTHNERRQMHGLPPVENEKNDLILVEEDALEQLHVSTNKE